MNSDAYDTDRVPFDDKGTNLRRKKLKRWLIGGSVIGGVVVILAVIIVAVRLDAALNEFYLNKHYEEGEAFIENGKYSRAWSEFYYIQSREDDYRDTNSYLSYSEARSYYHEGDIEKAYQKIQDLNFRYLTAERQAEVDGFVETVEAEYQAYEESKDSIEDSTGQRYSDERSTYTPPAYFYYKKNKDPYNVKDYRDAEDFYYDNYDDFYEYDEAEEYYNKHHE